MNVEPFAVGSVIEEYVFSVNYSVVPGKTYEMVVINVDQLVVGPVFSCLSYLLMFLVLNTGSNQSCA